MRSAIKPVHLMGRDIRLLATENGAVRPYLQRAFGNRLAEVRAAMEVAAASLPPNELNRVGFWLYEAFRPAVPECIEGWGAKGELSIKRIQAAILHTRH